MTRPIALPLFVLLLIISGGAKAEDRAPTAIEVPPANLAEWWMPSSTRFMPAMNDSSDESTPGKVRATLVNVRFEIGSDGLVQHAEVVRSSPDGADPEWALQAVEQIVFEPSPGNGTRTPVTSMIPVRLDSADAHRIDGRTESTALQSFERMVQSLPEGLRMQLQIAVLQLNLEGAGSASEAPEDLSISRIRERVDGMTAAQILAEAEKSARTPGAPRMIVEPAPPRIKRD